MLFDLSAYNTPDFLPLQVNNSQLRALFTWATASVPIKPGKKHPPVNNPHRYPVANTIEKATITTIRASRFNPDFFSQWARIPMYVFPSWMTDI
jgi:hypothetical protein